MTVQLLSGPVRSEQMAARIKGIREHVGVHPGALAKQVGVSRVTLLQWENRRCEPSLAMIEKLAEELGTTPEFLAFGPGVWNGCAMPISFRSVPEIEF